MKIWLCVCGEGTIDYGDKASETSWTLWKYTSEDNKPEDFTAKERPEQLVNDNIVE